MADGHGAGQRGQVKAPDYGRGLSVIVVAVLLAPVLFFLLLDLLSSLVSE